MNERTVDHNINTLFPNRWSPRAMSGEELSEKELLQLFEAARWAPSSYNGQPWHFLYAKKGSGHWDRFFNLLVEFNQQWVKNASVLLVILSQKNFEHNEKPNSTHAFDAGAAWENLALQASVQGIVAHGMSGFDHDAARTQLNIPETYHINAMVAMGKPGKKGDLPESMREKETPSGRKKVEEFITEGPWKAP